MIRAMPKWGVIAAVVLLLTGCAPAQQAGTAAQAPVTVTAAPETFAEQITTPATVTETAAPETVVRTAAPKTVVKTVTKTVTRTRTRTVTETSVLPPKGDPEACYSMVNLTYDMLGENNQSSTDWSNALTFVQNGDYQAATALLKNITARTNHNTDVVLPEFDRLSRLCTGLPPA